MSADLPSGGSGAAPSAPVCKASGAGRLSPPQSWFIGQVSDNPCISVVGPAVSVSVPTSVQMLSSTIETANLASAGVLSQS